MSPPTGWFLKIGELIVISRPASMAALLVNEVLAVTEISCPESMLALAPALLKTLVLIIMSLPEYSAPLLSMLSLASTVTLPLAASAPVSVLLTTLALNSKLPPEKMMPLLL